MKEDKLNPRQELFCQEYNVDSNATQAAIRAGYSDKAAKEIASRLLTKANIRSKINELKAQKAKETGITAQLVLRRLNETAEVAFACGDYSSSNRANELIGKHLKMFTEQIEVKDVTPTAVRLDKAKKRVTGS